MTKLWDQREGNLPESLIFEGEVSVGNCDHDIDEATRAEGQWPDEYRWYVIDDNEMGFLCHTEAQAMWVQRAARFCLGQYPLDGNVEMANPLSLIDQVVAQEGDYLVAAELLQKMLRGLFQIKRRPDMPMPERRVRYDRASYDRGEAWDDLRRKETDIPESHWRKHHSLDYWEWYTIPVCPYLKCSVCRPNNKET